MSTSAIVDAQARSGQAFELFGIALYAPSWYAVVIFPAFAIYCISMVGETNRAPFDLPEAEGELVGGFHTEYSSLKFALFFLAEYVNMVTVSAVATTVFLGGWRAPWPLSVWDGANAGWWPMLWFVLKLWAFLFVFIWLRGTLPRLRYDQFMRFGWKRLIPAALVWIVLVSCMRALQQFGTLDRRQRVTLIAGLVLVLALVYLVLEARATRQLKAAAEPVDEPGEVDPFAGGYPVPPLPGQRMRRSDGSVAQIEPAEEVHDG
jgi:NADH-quinone oxidoreductase subunit H